jgi:hypothetical protein
MGNPTREVAYLFHDVCEFSRVARQNWVVVIPPSWQRGRVVASLPLVERKLFGVAESGNQGGVGNAGSYAHPPDRRTRG